MIVNRAAGRVINCRFLGRGREVVVEIIADWWWWWWWLYLLVLFWFGCSFCKETLL